MRSASPIAPYSHSGMPAFSNYSNLALLSESLKTYKPYRRNNHHRLTGARPDMDVSAPLTVNRGALEWGMRMKTIRDADNRRNHPRGALGRYPQSLWTAVIAVACAAGTVFAQNPPVPPKVPDKLPELPAPMPAGDALGQPRLVAPPFGPGQIRMQQLDRRDMLGATPQPTPQELERFNKYVDGVVDPGNTFDLIEGRVRLLLLKQPPTRIQIADESVAEARPLTPPVQVTILGKKVGTTVLNLWFSDPNETNKEKILSYLIRVLPDPEAKDRVERAYKALQDEINRAFPNSQIRIFMVGDKLAVTGQAHDIAEATQILRIIASNEPGADNRARLSNIPVNSVRPSVRPGDPTVPPGGTPGQENFFQEGLNNIINLIRIPGEQQVMLKVIVAEVNRAAARSIGLNYNYFIANAGGRQIFNFAQNLPGVAPTLPIVIDQGRVNLAIQALRNVSFARSLAEPNVIALNGQTANFFAGGQFPVPSVGGVGVIGAVQGVNFVPFGVNLNFTPYITDKDRIRLNVSANVSTRDLQTGAQVAGTAVPGLSARNFQTTVELREGETLAVAGLIQNNLGGETSRIPFFGDLPIIGRLASMDRISSGEQELVILITPHLVRGLEKNELTPLPGINLYEPGDLEFYVHGRLESRRNYDYRSPIMNDFHRMTTYRRCESQYILGPTGHTGQP